MCALRTFATRPNGSPFLVFTVGKWPKATFPLPLAHDPRDAFVAGPSGCTSGIIE
jgi:hypothetical protein